jgi:glycosyltransferase involved in cell wall biosynthesis
MAPSGSGIVMVAYTHYPWDPRVRREAETLARRGHAVTIVCARDAGEPARETVNSVAVVRVPLAIRRGGPLRYLYQYAAFFLLAAAALRRLRPTAVHVHSVPDFLAFVAIGAKLRGVPLTLDLHEALPEMVLARFPRSVLAVRLARVGERLSCGLADRVIVVNETIRDLLASRGVPADRITVLYNSPDVAAAQEPARLPIAANGLRLVYAGAIDRERDLETLIRAVAELRRTRPAALVVYGPGEGTYLSYLRGLADGLGLADSVRFGGVLPADRVLAHLANADVGVVPYARNPITEIALPNKVFEFVVLDKPLVLPDLRAMRRAFADAAWFYAPGDAKDLAAKILLAAAAGAESATRRGRARAVLEGARWEVQAERLAAMYAAVARAAGA